MWNPKYFHEMITNRVIITTSVFAKPVLDEALEPDRLQGRIDERHRAGGAG